MADNHIGKFEYINFLSFVKYSDELLSEKEVQENGNKIKKYRLFEILDYAQGKRYENENVFLKYISELLKRNEENIVGSSCIPSVIKSKEFSDYMKILILEGLDSSDEMRERIEGIDLIGNFDVQSLKEIKERLKGQRTLSDTFDRYMFKLGEENSKGYVKETYNNQSLAYRFLSIINVREDLIYGEELTGVEEVVDYLLSLYNLYKEYLPSKLREFKSFVEVSAMYSLPEFIENYKSFVRNDFSTEFVNVKATVPAMGNIDAYSYNKYKERLDRAHSDSRITDEFKKELRRRSRIKRSETEAA